MNTTTLVRELYKTKQALYQLNRRERELKQEVHRRMTELQTNEFDVGEFVCTRTVQSRQYVRRADVPQELWEQLATPTQFPVLRVRPH